MKDEEERVVVVGGGIGGLSAANALVRQGIPVAVYEQAPELKEVGAGIQVWVNGMKAAHRLGVADALAAAGGRMEWMHFRSFRGPVIVTSPIGELSRRYGAPNPIMIRRPDLLRCLAAGLPAGTLHLGRVCVGCEQDEGGVTLRFADGSSERGALAVAGDGIGSVVRRSQFGEIAPCFAGYQYLRALIPYEDPAFDRNTFTFTFGPGDRFGSGDVGNGGIYWFAVLLTRRGEQDGPEGRKGELRRRFAGFAGAVRDIVERTPEASILRHDICDLDPLPRWTAGRVALMGDAAHAPTPNLGRGASEAMEDAWKLGERLGSVTSLADGAQLGRALAAFEAERRPATAVIQRRARKIGKLAGWKHPLAVRLRETIMGPRFAGSRMLKDLDREFAAYAL
jgi:2-polyprenyl-6-methoxyphenol hydroxylase-like FAD-dependent oxidoreductase